MNIPCIAHRIGRAKEHSHLARLQIQTAARMHGLEQEALA